MATAAEQSLRILTPAQKRSFDQDGYLHLPGFYDASAMAEMREQFRQLMATDKGRHRTVSHSYMPQVEGYGLDPINPLNMTGMMNHVAVNDYWFDHFTDPRIVSVMVDLLGPNIDFHNGKVRNKPPGFECKQSWHQDWPYEKHTKPDLAAALTYIEETGLDAGATEVIPGSHLKGEWPLNDDKVTIPEALVPPGSWKVCEAAAGDVVVIHVLVVHRAGHNRTNRSRHAIINEYKTMETIDLWGNSCAFANLPLARGGKPVLPRIG
ncbi:MAG: phytanoyl-CoA dioxygenase family protein [Planctomycetota bacterium]|nr:phytanoyl-CoA dioxygenase family protein [Planctomycetota bacterium]